MGRELSGCVCRTVVRHAIYDGCEFFRGAYGALFSRFGAVRNHNTAHTEGETWQDMRSSAGAL